MLPDYYEYLVQKSRQRELVERLQHQRLGNTSWTNRRRMRLLAPLQRSMCQLRIPGLHLRSCRLPAQNLS